MYRDFRCSKTMMVFAQMLVSGKQTFSRLEEQRVQYQYLAMPRMLRILMVHEINRSCHSQQQGLMKLSACSSIWRAARAEPFPLSMEEAQKRRTTKCNRLCQASSAAIFNINQHQLISVDSSKIFKAECGPVAVVERAPKHSKFGSSQVLCPGIAYADFAIYWQSAQVPKELILCFCAFACVRRHCVLPCW